MAVTDMDAGAMHVFTNSLLPFRAAFWFTLIQATFADHAGRLSAQESTPIAGATGVQSPAQTQLELIGEDPPAAPFFAGPIPRTRFIADDSGLNDVCGIGQLAWAVGERGVILRSADAGFTWSAQLLPIECSLQSVCFLTNQIGFVAGTQFNQFERRLQGILLGTKDGGSTWTQIRSEKLPSVRQVRFFDLANGIAICSPDQPNESSQVLRTSNGGATWQLVESDIKLTRWSAGDFLTPNDGILAGDGNSYGAIVSDEVVALAEPQNTLRRIRGASISRDGKGWLAGDGGVLLMSSNGGITWSATTNHLPPRMNEVFDFGSVDHRGSDVCIVGSPGCAILCSNDGGSSWRVGRTDSPVPLKKVQFVGDSVALAVGAFGVIHRSDDGGRTWRTVRNGEYRSAVLCLNADPEDVSFRMLAAMSGDQGYRSVIVQPSARLPQPGIDDVQNAQRVSVAASHAGAGFYDFEWRFARTQPMQEMTRGEIMEAWSQQTDGRIGEVLPQRLAQLIRVWRPEVVCVEYSGSENQLGPLMLQALEAAIRIAGSESAESTPGLLAECGLRPVQVKRIVARVPGGSTSPLTFEGDELLPRLATSTDLVANFCQRQLVERLWERNDPSSASDAYVAYSSGQAVATPAQLMSGTTHAPGSSWRRELPPASSEQLDGLTQLARADRSQRAALTGHVDQSGTPLSLIANLRTMGNDLPAPLALKQLQHLASLYASVENLEGEIAVLTEISERFPNSPANADAAEKLFQYYSSAELRLLRRRADPTDGSGGPFLSGNTGIQQVAGSPGMVLKSPVVNAGTGTSLPNSTGNDRSAIDANWDANANNALMALNRVAPQRAGSAEVLLRHAANLLRQEAFGRNRIALSQAAAGDGLYALLAQAEMQSTHGAEETIVPVLNLPRAESRPFLDGNLTEACWEDALETHLKSTDEQAGAPDCLIMFTWDDDHFYIAGRVERPEQKEDRMDQTAARIHDASHGTLDRVEFMLDTDRDYTTGYHFIIDEAGQTSDRCWKSGNWNPEWFVAAESDSTSWRFEAAIPQKELLDQPLKAGNLWAIRVCRTFPGVIQQSLKDKDSPGDLTGADGFGLLRFIRNRK